MKQKQVKQLQRRYEQKGLLAHPDLIADVQRALKAIPTELPKRKLKEMLSHYRILPLLEELDIYMHAITHGTISQDQVQRLARLEKLYQSLSKEKPYQQIMATDLESDRQKIVRFDPHSNSPKDLRFIITQTGACYADKRRLGEIVQAFYDDSILGGSIIVSVEKKTPRISKEDRRKMTTKIKKKELNPILAIGKYFVGVDNHETPLLAVDHYSFGDYHSRKLEDWLDAAKYNLFAYGPTAMLYLAEKLGIKKLVYCDLEMAEFVKQCGVGRKQVFRPIHGRSGAKHDGRKAGIVAVVDNSKGVWHHNHSIYKESSGRDFTLDYQPISMNTLYDQFEGICYHLKREVGYIRKNSMTASQHKKMRVKEKFTAMYTILRIMEDAYLKHRLFGQAKRLYNEAVDLVENRNPSFSMPHVK